MTTHLEQCPYCKSTKCALDEACDGCETKAEYDRLHCALCWGDLNHTGTQKLSIPPVDIHKCSKCNETIEIRQKSGF